MAQGMEGSIPPSGLQPWPGSGCTWDLLNLRSVWGPFKGANPHPDSSTQYASEHQKTSLLSKSGGTMLCCRSVLPAATALSHV